MIELESMAVAMPVVEGHPNRAAFRGVLTMVDTPSERAPSGSGGKRIVLTRAAAEAALPSLLGMALDYAPTFDRHDMQRKVGVITSAEVVGRELEVGGYLYAKDFPDVVEEVGRWGRRRLDVGLRASGFRRQESTISVQACQSEGARLGASLKAAVEEIRRLVGAARGPGKRQEMAATSQASELGMSFEVTDVNIADLRARIWTLTRVTFTGAAMLRKDKAAFQETWIELVPST